MWRIKLALKVLGGKLPALKTALKAFGFYRHGPMDSPSYAIGVFNKHFVRSRILVGTTGRESDFWPQGKKITRDRPISNGQGGVCLEIGPGESLLTMLVAKAAGFEKTIFIDKGIQIRQDIRPYLKMAAHLKGLGFTLPHFDPQDSVDSLIHKFGAEYLTDGLESFRKIPSQSIDFSFSHAVFEHIPLSEAGQFIQEIKRASKPGGFSSHSVDLKDHLGGSINHLRFSQKTWESPAIYNSGIYTNRLRFSEWMQLFKAEGTPYQILWKQAYPSLPVSKSKLASQFQPLESRDLLINGFDVVLRFSPSIEGATVEQ